MNKNPKGFTYLEMVFVVMILLILFSALLINYNPVTQKASARDKKRLSDLSTLDRAISEYILDNQTYPDSSNILRVSTILPAGSISIDNSTSGWIQADLSAYTSYLPIDPLNNQDFYYSYIHNENSYELNAKMEINTDWSVDDGGNDPLVYEIGNNLSLILP